MKKILLPFLLGLMIFTVSCEKENSEDVNQDKIYTDYELFYNKNTDKTVAVARFRFGGPTGTILELTDGATVDFNGDALTYNGWYGGHVKEYAGLVTSGAFSYTDVDGNTFNNSTPPMDTVGIPSSFDTLVKSQAYTLTWNGNALIANESIGVFIGSWTWGQDALFFQDQDGATDLVMGVNQMSNLALGSSTVYMDRTNATNVTQGTSEGGRIRSKYRATNVTAEVIQ